MPLTYLTVGNSYLVAPYSTIFPTTASIGTVSGTSVQITNITGPPNFTYSIIRNGTTIATGQTGSTYTDSTVAGSTTYTYQIVSTNQYSISNPITIGTVTTPVFIPFSVTGGTITAGTNNYSIATFTGTTGTFTPAVTKTYNYFIAAGGGGGGVLGDRVTGGGGAGGYILGSVSLTAGTTYTITIGGGGPVGTNGSNSTIAGSGLTTITAVGGGYGGAGNSPAGATGGSGGGGGYSTSGGAGTAGQGFAGNIGYQSGNGTGAHDGGGGGGATSAGGQGTGTTGGGASALGQGDAGGAGITITNTNLPGYNATSVFCGGGGGGLQNYGSSGTGGGTAGNGGSGGGGYGVAFYASGTGTPYYVNGITYTTTDVGTAKNGVINTGGGGGGTAGGTPNGVTAGSGGSGICIITGSGVAIPVISNYNFALPVNPTNNTNISCGSVGIGAPGAITLTTNIPSWSFTSGNNVGSLSIFITLGATALATSQLNYPTTNSQFCVLDITGSTVTGTTWVMMYQNLVFTTGTRTLSWYMQNGGNTHANAYFTASIGGISGATQNYTTTNAWVQYSLTFTVITAGTYPIQFTCGVVNNTGAYVVASIGNVVLV